MYNLITDLFKNIYLMNNNDVFTEVNIKFENNKLIVETYIPEHLEVKSGENGYGVFTNKEIKKGEKILTIKWVLLKEDREFDDEYEMRTNKGNFTLNKHIHTILNEDGSREISSVDVLFNHTCDFIAYSHNEGQPQLDSVIANKDFKEEKKYLLIIMF